MKVNVFVKLSFVKEEEKGERTKKTRIEREREIKDEQYNENIMIANLRLLVRMPKLYLSVALQEKASVFSQKT